MKTNNKLIITGITGKSGQFFLDEILNNSNVVNNFFEEIVFAIHNENKIRDIKEKIEKSASNMKINFIVGDLNDEKYCNRLCENGECLFHIAGIQKSEMLVRCAVEKGIKKIVLVHTTGIYSKYKQAGEQYRIIEKSIYEIVKNNNVKLTILRPTMIYGNINDKNISVFIKMVDKLKIMPVVNGARYELQPVHCKDLGIAYYKLLINLDKCIGKDYVLSGGEPIELRQIFEEIAHNLGVTRKYISCPFIIAYFGAWVIYLISFTKKDYREKVQRLCEPRVYSHEEATNDFGYLPMKFQEGIIGEVEEYKMRKK